MLDKLRSKASLWLVKIILTMIILSFALFFGVSDFASDLIHPKQTVATINDSVIPRQKYTASYENALDQMSQSFKGGLPKGLEQVLSRNVLQQLVDREVFYQYGLALGITAEEKEIAENISSNKNFQQDGVFHLKLYQEQFLPFYYQKHGENYENEVRKQVVIEKFYNQVENLSRFWNETLNESGQQTEKTLKNIPFDKEGFAKKYPDFALENILTKTTDPIDAETFLDIWLDEYKQTLKIKTEL